MGFWGLICFLLCLYVWMSMLIDLGLLGGGAVFLYVMYMRGRNHTRTSPTDTHIYPKHQTPQAPPRAARAAGVQVPQLPAARQAVRARGPRPAAGEQGMGEGRRKHDTSALWLAVLIM